ncbi:MAG: glutamate--tRNA ligase family protein [Candidatus Paceibacterota bacterium]|jgi:glutamyl-tRNA synthetase
MTTILDEKESLNSKTVGQRKIIARFPPSPTGWFHIGNARTALFNYFFVKQNNGELKFRLEDTDKERSKDEYSLDIVEGLKWLGIDIDYNHPYKQSEHGETYRKYIEKMIAEDKAYISKEEVKEEGQRAEVIRLRNPGKKIIFEDMIRGNIEVDTTELGDFVIAKSINEPIYHLAVVVDDFEMGVNHVIRGEDGIYNTPRQILIQEAIGATRPIYAHMPFMLNTDRSKLSKRQQGELVSLKYYKKKGFLPEAMLNYLAFCGWNPGDETELMSMDEIIKKFDIMKVQKAGAIFNVEKLLWYNKEYLKKLPIEKVEEEIKNRLPKSSEYENISLIKKIASVVLERINVWSDIDKMVVDGEIQYFFTEPEVDMNMVIWKKGGTIEEAKINLNLVSEILKDIKDEDFNLDIIKDRLMKLAEEKGKGNVLWPLRVSLSGKEKSPDPFTLVFLLGREVSLRRIESIIFKLSK